MSNDFDDSSPEAPRKPSISRRATLEYFNPAGAGSWFRRTFGSHDKVIDGLKTLAWVIPLTLLIWIYAERQQLLQNPAVVPGVTVDLRKDPSRSVLFSEPGDQLVTLKLMGPQEGVRRAIDRLTQRIPHESLEMDLGSDRTIGDNQLINIIEHIQNLEVFKSNGVTVQEAQPAELRVNIDRLDHREAPVQIPPGHANITATTDPQKVVVEGPQGVLQDLANNKNLRVYLHLDGYSQLQSPGTYDLKNVPVDLSVPNRLQIEPNHVDATVVVAQSDVHYKIPDPVNVWIEALPSTLRSYTIEPTDGSIRDVEVAGPKDAIDLIEQGTYIPRARLIVTSDDAFKQTPIVPEFDLPPGVVVVSEHSKDPVKITATSR